jgi:dihydrofolate synthase/folylpolyglutamate synthase
VGYPEFLRSLIRPDFRPYAVRAPLALESVARLLARVGDPHLDLRVIHIAGSKGKGSTALLAEAVLEALGYRTGTFTSPHLQRWTERIRVAGREVADPRLAGTLERLRPHVEALSREHSDNPPSFFDVLTAAALVLFRETDVDYVIMETGIGGRHDATNIVQPVVTCITGVELEHTDKLGSDLAAIAREKAGIIKPGIPVICAPLPAAAAAEMAAQAAACAAPLLRLGREIPVEIIGDDHLGPAFRIRLPDWELEAKLAIPGRHQAQNAALAVACVDRLAQGRLAAQGAAVCAALATVGLPGRNEILERAPWVVVDAAHTPGSVRALRATLDALPARERHFVLSFSAGKPLRPLCEPLLEIATAVTATRAEPTRSEAPEVVATILRQCAPALPIRIEPDATRAVRDACRALGPEDLLCATGSVYMAGLARTILLKELEDLGQAALRHEGQTQD